MRPLVIGHRGARRLAIENTLESLRIALAEGADGVEFDVQRTADGELVLFHDDSLRRLCGQRGRVTQLPWRELRGLRLRQDGLPEARIAHLDEVLELLAGSGASVDCELKAVSGNGPRLAEAVLPKLLQVDVARWWVSSFDAATLRRLADVQAPVRLAALVDRLPCDFSPLKKGTPPAHPIASVNPAWQLVNPDRLAAWRGHGWQVWPWTVNAPRAWDELREAGVDAIITDLPGELVRRWR
jgi:glycerophosphoryl diester phosphodiesterase